MYRIKTGEYSYIGNEDWAVEYFFQICRKCFKKIVGLKMGVKLMIKL